MARNDNVFNRLGRVILFLGIALLVLSVSFARITHSHIEPQLENHCSHQSNYGHDADPGQGADETQCPQCEFYSQIVSVHAGAGPLFAFLVPEVEVPQVLGTGISGKPCDGKFRDATNKDPPVHNLFPAI